MSAVSGQPARKRRSYWEGGQPLVAGAGLQREPGSRATLEQLVEALVRHRRDWRPKTTARNCRHYLLGTRWLSFCQREGIVHADELTTEHVARFLEENTGEISNEYLVKYRTYFRALASFQRAVPGWGEGLGDADRIPKPYTAKLSRKRPPSLSREQEPLLVQAANPGRDRLIVEALLATGVRVSELCAILIGDCVLSGRLPYIHVRGSVHDPGVTKSGEDRDVGFRSSYRGIAKRLATHIAERDPGTLHQELFLSRRTDGDRAAPQFQPLTIWGVEQLFQRLSQKVGFHAYPHLMRHTWATRLVDGGMAPLHLKQAGGWKSITMVERYYAADTREMLEAFERIHA